MSSPTPDELAAIVHSAVEATLTIMPTLTKLKEAETASHGVVLDANEVRNVMNVLRTLSKGVKIGG